MDLVDKLLVLMSVYNGKKYLKEQLDSIMGQDCEEKGTAELYLMVRDDGSSDGTQNILKEYSEKYPGRINWYQGNNKGVIKSFFDLMVNAGVADYYALADQDDYWLPQKMDRGIKKLKQMEGQAVAGNSNTNNKDKGIKKSNKQIPLLYCCRPELTDKDLVPLVLHVENPKMEPGFGNALIENIVTGCTTVFNSRLLQMAAFHIPEHATMHDRWLYLIATCFGKIYYDETPYIYYRQHGDNAVGKNTGKIPELKYRIKKFKKDFQGPGRQAAEFLQVFNAEFKEGGSDLHGKEKLLRLFIKGKKSSRARKALVKGRKLYRQRKLDDRIFKILIRMNLY